MAAYRNSEHFAKAFAVFNMMRKFVTSLHFVHLQAILTNLFYTEQTSFVMLSF